MVAFQRGLPRLPSLKRKSPDEGRAGEGRWGEVGEVRRGSSSRSVVPDAPQLLSAP